jgi:hypothetical protein
MEQESARSLLNAASFCQEFGESFADCAFDEHSHAIEVFVLQSSSHCEAAAILLEHGSKGEAVAILRSVQELCFDLNWILSDNDRSESLERTIRLEADPYEGLDREIKLMEQRGSTSAIAMQLRIRLDAIAAQYPYLTEVTSDCGVVFKKALSFADRMGRLRERYYHIFRYGSLFVHPTPTVKRLYLRTDDPKNAADIDIDESISRFVAYTLQFVAFIMDFAEKCLGSFAPSGAANRDTLYANVVDIVKQANKGYFHIPPQNNFADEFPGS